MICSNIYSASQVLRVGKSSQGRELNLGKPSENRLINVFLYSRSFGKGCIFFVYNSTPSIENPTPLPAIFFSPFHMFRIAIRFFEGAKERGVPFPNPFIFPYFFDCYVIVV